MRSISYPEFVQRIRSFKRSEFLRALGRENARLSVAKLNDEKRPPRDPIVPFALGGMARVAIMRGSEYRDKALRDGELRKLCHEYLNMKDPLLESHEVSDSVRPILNRALYEQIDSQTPFMVDLGRTTSLLIDHMAALDGAPTEREWSDLLGCDLDQFIRIGFALHVAATMNGGTVSEDLLRQPNVSVVFDPLGVDAALGVVRTWFEDSLDGLRARGSGHEVAGSERWSFNPLIERPVVRMGDDLVMPWSELCVRRVTPTGLYYVGVERWGSDFAQHLGQAFEDYIGSHLKLLGEAIVMPEIVYGKSQSKTVDYFVVTDEVVLLVEVKSARPIMSTRLGQEAGDQDITKKVGHALKQIDRTAALLEEGHEALTTVPRDRPVRGVVVTLEPFYLVNTMFYSDVLERPRIPTSVVSAGDLEELIGVLAPNSGQGGRLLKAFTPAHDNVPLLSEAVEGLEFVPNSLIEQAWDRFHRPWEEAGVRLRGKPATD